MSRRVLTVVALSAAAMMGSVGVAAAQDCFIVNRSAQGNAGASNSGQWVTQTVEQFVNSPEFPPNVDKTCFLTVWSAGGGPSSFTVRTDKVIGENSSNPNLGNGKGLDHIDDAYSDLIGKAFGTCAK